MHRWNTSFTQRQSKNFPILFSFTLYRELNKTLKSNIITMNFVQKNFFRTKTWRDSHLLFGSNFGSCFWMSRNFLLSLFWHNNPIFWFDEIKRLLLSSFFAPKVTFLNYKSVTSTYKNYFKPFISFCAFFRLFFSVFM